MEFRYKEFTFTAGNRIRCKIKGIDVFDAVLNFEKYKGIGDRIYICHNMSDLSGASCYNKYGYKYSYCFRGREFNNGVASSLSDEVEHLYHYDNVKSNIFIDHKIYDFLKVTNKEYLIVAFLSKIGIYDDYNRYFMSDKDGFLILKTTPESENKEKTLMIKFGRFLKAFTTRVDETFERLNDSDIELLYNKWVSYQNKSLLKIEYLYGNDILKGYTKSNQLEYKDSSLYGSCMNDKHDFLELYTKNENVVKLAVMYIDGKIAARSLVWTTISGPIVHDKIYACKDWVYNSFIELLSKENILPIQNYTSLFIKLDKWKFSFYPYVDSFYCFDKNEGNLIYLNRDRTVSLQNQSGGPYIRWNELH